MINNKLDIKLKQNLIVTQSQILSLKLLEMNQIELKEYLINEYESNPILKKQELEKINLQSIKTKHISNKTNMDEQNNTLDYAIYYDKNIEIELLFQLDVTSFSNKQIEIMKYLIGLLDDKGFFKYDLKDISQLTNYNLKELKDCLEILKQLEPEGIFSENPEQCLIYQYNKHWQTDDEINILIKNNLQDLLLRNVTKINKQTSIKQEKIREVIDKISDLTPYPFYNKADSQPEYIIPDILVYRINNVWKIELNDTFIDEYTYDDYYLSLIQKAQDEELKKYLNINLERARFAIESIKKRRKTILKIVKNILDRQENYFLKNQPLKPMTLSDIANDLDISESTVSRAVKYKYMQYKKMYLLKELFSNKVNVQGNSSKEVKNIIKNIIDSENKKSPYSDLEIKDIVLNQGIKISRRTVTKYRESMDILNSSKRKK